MVTIIQTTESGLAEIENLFPNKSKEVLRISRGEVTSNNNIMGNPDFLFNTYERDENKSDVVKKYKKQAATSDHIYVTDDFKLNKTSFKPPKENINENASFVRLGISLWIKLDHRATSTVANDAIEKMLFNAVEARVKKKSHKKNKQEEKTLKKKIEANRQYLVAVLQGDAKLVSKFMNFPGVDVNITFEQLQALYIEHRNSEANFLIESINRTAKGAMKTTLQSVQLPPSLEEALETNIASTQSATSYSPTPFLWAITLHHHEVFKILLKHPGVDINKVWWTCKSHNNNR